MNLLNFLEPFNSEIKINEYHIYSLEESNEDAFTEVSKLENDIIFAFQASLASKKGLFLIKDLESFKSSCNSSLLRKHFYIDKENDWLYIAPSLKKRIIKLNSSDLFSFNLNNLENCLKNIFSD